MNRDNLFLRNEYLKNLFPVMFSVLGGTINALIDSALVSQKLGSDGIAAVNMSLPIYLLICTFGSLIAGGASFLSAQSAGDDRMDDSRRVYHSSVLVSLIIGVLISVIFGLLCHPVSDALAQGGELSGYVYDYSIVTVLGAVPFVLVYTPLYYLQLEGKTKAISVMMIIMIIVDVILDILLMFVFDMALYGAALASLISTFTACVYGFVMLERGYSNYHFKIKEAGIYELQGIFRFGSPTAIGNFVDSLKLLALNWIILNTGGAAAAAVWAVLNSLSEFGMTITSGVPQAAAPMMGAYFTSRENSGLRILAKLQAVSGMTFSVIYAVVLVLFHSVIENIFSSEADLTFPLMCLGAYCVLDLFCSIWITFFNSAGRITLSNCLVIFRKLVFPIGAAAVISSMNGYLWLFLPIAAMFTLASGLASTGIVRKKADGKYPLSRILLLDDTLEIDKKVIDFSITPTPENICSGSEQIKDFCQSNEMNLKLTMRLGLAIEELLTVISQRIQNTGSVDLRAFSVQGVTGIRIRYAGRRYNPFSDETDEDFLMGINMIDKMAESVTYTYSLGMNIINILFEKSSAADAKNSASDERKN